MFIRTECAATCKNRGGKVLQINLPRRGERGSGACLRPNSNARAAQSKIILRVEEESLAIQPSIGLGSVARLFLWIVHDRPSDGKRVILRLNSSVTGKVLLLWEKKKRKSIFKLNWTRYKCVEYCYWIFVQYIEVMEPSAKHWKRVCGFKIFVRVKWLLLLLMNVTFYFHGF